MKTNNTIREKILNQPSYWVEGVNGYLYDAIVNYMEANKLNRTRLADHLGISKGRVSQILNDGEINFSLEKIVEIALKIDKFPVFEFQDKQKYLQREVGQSNVRKMVMNYDNNAFSPVMQSDEKEEPKLISLNPHVEERHQLVL